MQNDDLNAFLVTLGWNEFFKLSFADSQEPGQEVGHFPGRVISQGKGHYQVQIGPQVAVEAIITSKLRHAAKSALDFPGVGDWVAMTSGQGTKQATIQRVLNRKTVLQRKRPGAAHDLQLIATNVDFVFIVTSLNEDFDIERLGRYLALCLESGATPIFILTKVDLCDDPQTYVDRLNSEYGNVQVFKITKNDRASMDQLQQFFAPGMTTVLLGSSGVGKSTLTNYFLGEELQKTQGLSGESRGRHTTTSRNLLFTRWGGLVIDSPGMQDVATVEPNEEPLEQFSDIEELTLQCKFTNCRHGNDPGCAITASIKKGLLSQERWGRYLKKR